MGFNEQELYRRMDAACSGQRHQDALQATLICSILAYNPTYPIDFAATEVLLHGIACYLTITRTTPAARYLFDVVRESIVEQNRILTVFPREY